LNLEKSSVAVVFLPWLGAPIQQSTTDSQLSYCVIEISVIGITLELHLEYSKGNSFAANCYALDISDGDQFTSVPFANIEYELKLLSFD